MDRESENAAVVPVRNIVHGINNALQGIVARAGLAPLKWDSEKESKEFMSGILQEAERIREFVDHFKRSTK